MAITGQMALAKLQVAREVVSGTTQAATRAIPIMSGNLKEHIEKVHPHEQRESFIANHRAYSVKRFVEVSGMEVAPTYEIFPWFANFAISCNMSGSPTAVTARSYAFSTNETVNDIGTATLEVGDDTDTFIVNQAFITRMEFAVTKGQPATMTVDWLGQKATSGSFTSNISMPTNMEDIQGSHGTAYLDASGGTIGSTTVTNINELKVSIDTKQAHFWGFNGAITPVDVYRSDSRSASVEAKLAFLNTTEYDAYQADASATGSSQRKIRFVFSGSNITGTSPTTAKSLTFDLYTIWDEADFGDEDGLRVVNFKGQTQKNTSAGHDFRVTVVNGINGMHGNP